MRSARCARDFPMRSWSSCATSRGKTWGSFFSSACRSSESSAGPNRSGCRTSNGAPCFGAPFPWARLQTLLLVSCDEHPSVVLRVDLSVRADREWRVGSADRQVREYLVDEIAIAIDDVQVAVFAVREDGSVNVNRRRVHTPLESMRVVSSARQRAVGVSLTTVRVGVLKSPVDLQVGCERAHEVLLPIIGL